MLAVGVASAYYIFTNKNFSGSEGVACTLEAKLCPDGSYVGRSGPRCEFTRCPEITVGNKTSLGKAISYNSILITPLRVVGDSRCPLDVQCIQAGTVTLTVRLQQDANVEEADLTLGKAKSFGGKRITLTNVSPAPYSKKTISDADYVFTFDVE